MPGINAFTNAFTKDRLRFCGLVHMLGGWVRSRLVRKSLSMDDHGDDGDKKLFEVL